MPHSHIPMTPTDVQKEITDNKEAERPSRDAKEE
jgi:hypothetical protein